jgi:SAM-dependent methyltransferase
VRPIAETSRAIVWWTWVAEQAIFISTRTGISADTSEWMQCSMKDFPRRPSFAILDLDRGGIQLPDQTGDMVAAIEVIQHLENPRECMRDLARLATPDGWIAVTTPNQVSWLSLTARIRKQRFQAFQDMRPPVYLTALREVDLRRIAAECGLANVAIEYSAPGRIPPTGRHYPRRLSRRWPRACSANVLPIGPRKDR